MFALSMPPSDGEREKESARESKREIRYMHTKLDKDLVRIIFAIGLSSLVGVGP
jgi:hypothetical protein